VEVGSYQSAWLRLLVEILPFRIATDPGLRRCQDARRRGWRAGRLQLPTKFISPRAFIKPTSKLAQPQKPSGLNETEDSLGEPRQASMPPRVRGRKEDRPKALTSKKVQQVLILYNAKKHTIDEICRSFNISRLSYIDTLRH
jgi:Helix-turn-helix domain of resolvase